MVDEYNLIVSLYRYNGNTGIMVVTRYTTNYCTNQNLKITLLNLALIPIVYIKAEYYTKEGTDQLV